MIVECSSCEARVNAEVLQNYVTVDDAGAWRIDFLKCPECDSPFLTSREHIGGDEWGDPSRLYPPREEIDPAVPASVARVFFEANSCFKCGTYVAAAMMCRKAVAAMCKEQGTGRRNLAKALERLKNQGVIEGRLLEWAEALRIAGNEAAHDIDTSVSRDDARDLLEFTNALLQYVFTFTARFEDFTRRRRGA